MAKNLHLARMQSNEEELSSKIPGWGSDLDMRNRPGIPKEKTPAHGTGAHWKEPDRQVPKVKIHKSPEHARMTPVFGTACPPKGLSGILRDVAYRYSEGKMSHWMTLLLADRVNVIESRVSDLLRGHPDNPIKESGIAAEFKRHGLSSRMGQRRADITRMRNQVLLVAGMAAIAWPSLKNLRPGARIKPQDG
jgi:hypothetical protein